MTYATRQSPLWLGSGVEAQPVTKRAGHSVTVPGPSTPPETERSNARQGATAHPSREPMAKAP